MTNDVCPKCGAATSLTMRSQTTFYCGTVLYFNGITQGASCAIRVLTAENERLREENAKLREACQAVVEAGSASSRISQHTAHQLARAALAEKGAT